MAKAEFVSVSEAARLLDVSKATLHKWEIEDQFSPDGSIGPNGYRIYLRSRVLQYKAELDKGQRDKPQTEQTARQEAPDENRNTPASPATSYNSADPEKLNLGQAARFLNISHSKLTTL